MKTLIILFWSILYCLITVVNFGVEHALKYTQAFEKWLKDKMYEK